MYLHPEFLLSSKLVCHHSRIPESPSTLQVVSRHRDLATVSFLRDRHLRPAVVHARSVTVRRPYSAFSHSHVHVNPSPRLIAFTLNIRQICPFLLVTLGTLLIRLHQVPPELTAVAS